jgi:hypothetical protein
MAYDLMNRRDTKTAHHTSVQGALDVVKNYLDIGAPASKMNLGFAFYAKYFQTTGSSSGSALGAPIVQAEDPITGKDSLTSGAWTFEPAHMNPVDNSTLKPSYDGTCGPDKGTKCASACCSQYGNCGSSPEHCGGGCWHAFGTGCTDPDVAGSWQIAASEGVADEKLGGRYFFDAANKLFWTWDSPEFIAEKFEKIVRKYKLGGVMAWSLGEDSADWSHIGKISEELGKGGYATPGSDDGGEEVEYPVEEVAPVVGDSVTTLVTVTTSTERTTSTVHAAKATGYQVVNVDGGETAELEADAGGDADADADDGWEYYYTDEEGNEYETVPNDGVDRKAAVQACK